MIKAFAWLFGIVLIGLAVAVLLLQSSESWTPAQSIKTPQDRFENLPDYPFTPNYAEISGYLVHYVDEGPRDGPVILLMHGQPSWSYLYRHMIPPLVDAG